MNDTDPQMERIQIDLLRRAGAAHRAELMCSLSSELIEMNRQTIRRLHPEMSEREAMLHFVALNYGAELAHKVRAFLARRRA